MAPDLTRVCGTRSADELLEALLARDPSKTVPPLTKTPAQLIAEALGAAAPAGPGGDATRSWRA